MVTLNLYGGPLKRTLIQRAYGMCGQSVTEFELTPEEYGLALQCMDQIAREFGSTFGYNFPAYGDGSAADESGIADVDVLGFTVRLAQEIGPNIGKAFSPNGPQARAASTLTAKYQTTPMMELGRQTIRGAGSRLWTGPRPFFSVAISDEEVIQ